MSDPFAALFGTVDVESEDDKVKRYLLEGTGINPDKKYKLNMFDALRAMDAKDRKFYDKLNAEEKKGFAPFVMVRWSSVVSNSNDLAEWYLIATNLRFNTSMLPLMSGDIKHPKLAWLIATTVSPGMGVMKHEWIGYKKKETTKAIKPGVRKFLIGEYPTLSDDEIELLLSTLTNKEIKAYAINLGHNDKTIKSIFK